MHSQEAIDELDVQDELKSFHKAKIDNICQLETLLLLSVGIDELRDVCAYNCLVNSS